METKVLFDYRSLRVWQVAVDFAVELHRCASFFPEGEKFALTSQLQRAAYSIPLNIAEGNMMSTARAKRHAIDLARGSLAEVETLLVISERLGYLDSNSYLPTCGDIGRMLTGLRRAASDRPKAPVLRAKESAP